MSLELLVAAFAAVLFSSPGVSRAEDCRLGQQTYPSNIRVCSGGLVLLCVNGNWQSGGGERCEGLTGSYIGARRPLAEKNDEDIPEYVKEKYPGLDLR